MADCTLRYRPGAVASDDLAIGECTIRPLLRDGDTFVGWGLWLRVLRANDGKPEVFRVPVIPRGQYSETGPGGRRSWGLNEKVPGTWQISPSIHYTEERPAEGEQPARTVDVWHKTPEIVGVPAWEPWL